MGFVGKEPAEAALTSADITDGIIVDADINACPIFAKFVAAVDNPPADVR